MKKILITPKALKDLEDIESFLLSEYGSKVKDDFILVLRKTLHLLTQNPLLGTSFSDTRKLVVSKQISIIYDVEDQQIVILFFWDNRRKPLW